jgi:periplasmic divalent cation tolerance protein
MEIATIYLTASSSEEAMAITRQLLSERLIACANILSEITSVYRWEGQVHADSEVPVLLKTRTSLVDTVTSRIRELHSYRVPCIVAWRSAGGNEAYFQWVHAETEISGPMIA